jgi:uncharacterized HAD superfamily protein
MSTSNKKKKKLIIGIDFDDVILDFNTSLHAYHNKKYGTSVARKDIISYSIENVWGCTSEEASRKVFEFYSTAEHDNALPVQGAVEALNELKKDYELHLISVRGDQIKDLTIRWINKNFPNYFKSVSLTNQYFGIKEKVRSKADVCKELGIDVMIEDSLPQAKEIAASGRKVLLMDCPWNQSELPENIIRVYSWGEIVEHLGKM